MLARILHSIFDCMHDTVFQNGLLCSSFQQNKRCKQTSMRPSKQIARRGMGDRTFLPLFSLYTFLLNLRYNMTAELLSSAQI